MQDFIDGLTKIQGQVDSEAQIHGITWWNGGWEVKVLNYVPTGAGSKQPRLETWKLESGTRVE